MKKSILLLTGLVFSLLLSAIASANLTTDLTDNTLLIGDSNAEPKDYYENSFIINTSQNLNISINPINPFSIDDIKVNMSQIKQTNQSEITISAFIPRKVSAVDSNGNPVKPHVANLNIYEINSSNNSVEIKLLMQRKNHLVFDRITLESADYSRRITDRRKVDFLMPGDSARVEFRIKNTFRENIDIEDVRIYIYDDRNDLRIDEDETIGRIRDRDDHIEYIHITLDEDVDEGSYKVIMKVIGEEENSDALHGDSMTMFIDIRRERDDITISRINFDPSLMTNCHEQMLRLLINLKNIGRNDQRRASVTVENIDLGYSRTITDISIDQLDHQTQVFTTMIPEGIAPGSYVFKITAFNDRSEIRDEQIATFTIRPCPTEDTQLPIQERPETDESHDTVVIGAPSYSDITSAQPISSDLLQPSPERQEDRISLTLLIALFILLLIIAIVLIIMIFKK